MNMHKLRVLLVVAAVAIVLALWSSQVRQPSLESTSGGVLWPNLLENLDRVSALSVSRGGEALLDIEQGGDVWGVAQRHGYPVDMTRLREYLMKLAEARLVEPKTSNPENFVQLGVEDPTAANASGLRVTIRGMESEHSLIVGRYNGQGSGTFVRRPDEMQSWLVNADLTLDMDPARWLRREIVDVPSSQVRALTLTHGDGEVIRAEKSDVADSVFQVADIPEGRVLTSEFAASGLAGFLASLRLDDVHPAADTEVPNEAIQLSYDTFDGRRYAMRIWDEDGRYLLVLNAGLTAELGAPDVQAGKAAGEAEDAPIVSEVESLNALTTGWIFQIPSFKWSTVNKRMEDLLKPVGSE